MSASKEPFPVLRAALREWATAHRAELDELQTSLELKCSAEDYPKPMIALTLEGEDRIGQLILWETGESELSVIEVESENDLLVESRDIQSLFGLQEGLDAVVAVVLGQEKRLPLEVGGP